MKRYAILLVLFSVLAATTVGAAGQPDAGTPAGVRVIYSGEAGMVLEMTTPAYQTGRVSLGGVAYDRVTIPGAEDASEPGEPQVPVLSALLGVPAEAELQIEIISDRKTRLPGRYRLPPAPTPLRQGDDLEYGGLVYVPDDAVYAADAFYPDSPVRVAEQGWLRDQRVVRLAFAPLQYNPVRGAWCGTAI